MFYAMNDEPIWSLFWFYYLVILFMRFVCDGIKLRGSSPHAYDMYAHVFGELHNKSFRYSKFLFTYEKCMYVVINYQKGGD